MLQGIWTGFAWIVTIFILMGAVLFVVAFVNTVNDPATPSFSGPALSAPQRQATAIMRQVQADATARAKGR